MRDLAFHTCWRRSFPVSLTIFACALLGCDGGTRHPIPKSGESERSIYALGRLEPATGIISISAVPGERLKELDPDVEENQKVPVNGILGLLTSFDLGRVQLEALLKKQELASKTHLQQIEIAKAQKAQAEASLSQALAKLRELELRANKLQTLETASHLAAEEHAQLEQLRSSDPEMVTEHQLKKQRNAMESALDDFTIAHDSYDSAQEAAEKTVLAAQANLGVANLSLEQLSQNYDAQAIQQEIKVAQETLKRSVLLSPHVTTDSIEDILKLECVVDHQPDSPDTRGPYTVLKSYLRSGEFIAQTPVLQLGDLSQMVCVAEVYEADVKNLQIDQATTIRSPAFSGKFADGIDPESKQRTGGIAGRIEQIGGVIGSPGLMNRNPLAPADRSVVEVRIRIEDAEAIAEVSRRVGLQVTVEFASESGKTPVPVK